MNTATTVVRWAARVLGILYIGLLIYGWWDEVQARGGQGSWDEQWAVLTHVLPILVILAAFMLAWPWPIAGAIGFIGYAVATVFSYAPEWGYAWLVTGPPLLVGLLFLVEWLLERRAARRDG
jgi:hypothetical protein